MTNPLHKLLAPAPLVLFLFVMEAILAKSVIPGVVIPFRYHMYGTILLLGLLVAMFWIRRPAVLAADPYDHRLNVIRLIVVIMMFLGLVSCLPQNLLVANIVFWCLWALNLYVIWWCVPSLLADWSLRQRLALLALVLVVCVVGSLVLHPVVGAPYGRLRGIFKNATFSGRFMALASVFLLAVHLNSTRRRLWPLSIGALAVVLLVMTRTRAAIAAAGVGCAAVLLIAAMSQTTRAKRNLQLSFALGLALVGGAFVFAGDAISRHFTLDNIATHLRVDAPLEDVFADRSVIWSRAYNEFWSHGVFGRGFLSKFGNADDTEVVMGIAVPRYDWMLENDPHNMFFTTAQQQGIPAAIILLLLLYHLFRAGGRLPLEPKCALWGWLTVGITFGCLQGNWLTSFGDPIDRFSLVALSLLISRPAVGSRLAKRTTGGPQRGQPVATRSHAAARGIPHQVGAARRRAA